METIRVPSLAENVREATIGKWLIAPGDKVEKDGEIAELLTEKAEFTLESDYAGTLTARLAPEKSVMPVGSILCVLDGTEDDVDRCRAENDLIIRKHLSAATVEMDQVDMSSLKEEANKRSGGGVRATPAARRLAKEKGVSLEEVAKELDLSGPIKDTHVREYLGI